MAISDNPDALDGLEAANPGVRASAGQKSCVRAVGIVVIVMCWLGMTINALSAALMLQRREPSGEDYSPLVYGIYQIVLLVYAIPILFGAICMARLKHAVFAIVGLILALVPILSPLFVLAIPFAIWGLILLWNPRIRAEFNR